MFSRSSSLHILVVTASLTFFGSAGSAFTGAIACPEPELRREVTTPLSGGWWNTPQVDVLRGTEVREIAGHQTMVCDYGRAGRIMRRAPEDSVCTAASTGFACRAERRRPVLWGDKILQQTFTLKLSPGAEADIWFEAETERNLFLTGLGGVQFGAITDGPLYYEGCRDSSLGVIRYGIRLFRPGQHVCIKTRNGRIGELKIGRLRGDSGSRQILVDYKVWAND